MPIVPSITTRRLSQKEFGALAYEVMDCVFAIHGDFGRFFDEKIYKKELAARMKGVLLEAFVDVVHGSFTKRYFADVIICDGGLFEFKAAEAIHDKHRGQTIHYLLLFDLAHGKIINVRTEEVKHEFVNCHRRSIDLRNPRLLDDVWNPPVFGSSGHLADQRMRLITPESAFKLTTFSEPPDTFTINTRKLLRHTQLKTIHWANLTHDQITFVTIRP
jgi:GxxExxY protein